MTVFWSTTLGLVLICFGLGMLCYSFMRENPSRPRPIVPPNETAIEKMFRIGKEPVLDLKLRHATFAWFSVLWPLIGAVVVAFALITPAALLGFLSMPVIPLIGFVCAGISWLRRENYPWISALGILLNIMAAYFAFQFWSHIKLGC
jgi:hypothetical protein